MNHREHFPQLSAKVYGKDLIYLDNAATSLRPDTVVEEWSRQALDNSSNLHRAVHYFAGKATAEFENARRRVAGYLGADEEEIAFVSGATHALNLVAYSFSEYALREGDNIIVSEEEHHSNLVPWQLNCERKKAQIRVLPVDANGRLEIEKLESLIDDRTRMVAVAQISNVLGLHNPVAGISAICRKHGVALLVDGAQGIVHGKVDLHELGCDFYVFSGHKIYAATGTGVLYARKGWFDKLPPFMSGGEMIDRVSWESTTFMSGPRKFEAGTQNYSSVPTLVPALELAEEMGEGELPQICEYILDEISRRERIRLFGSTDSGCRKAPLFSITVEGAHHEDLALILDKMGIAVRSGEMCAAPLMKRFGVEGMLRASFAPYNTLEEARKFIAALDKAIKMLD